MDRLSVSRTLIALCLMAGIWPSGAAAQANPGASALTQPPSTTVILYELTLRDGSRAYGRVETETEDEVVFVTEAGSRLTARRAEILTLRLVSGRMQNGEFQPADPNRTRLFFGPTGHSLDRGQVSIGVYEFLMPFVQVGVTDRFSVGGGTPLVFGGGDWDRPFWITPKYQIVRTASTHVAVGVLQAFGADGHSGGVAYVVGTNSAGQRSVSIGGGLAYDSDGGRSAVVMVGAEGPLRRHMRVITENYIWKNRNGVASAGVRFFGDRLSADLALAIPIGADGVYVFPVVNFVYVFSK
jgi:hypothetical protein